MNLLDRLWEAYQERPFLSNTLQSRLDLSHDETAILLDTLADMADNGTIRAGYTAKRIAPTTYKVKKNIEAQSTKGNSDSSKGLPLTPPKESLVGANTAVFDEQPPENGQKTVGCLIMPLRTGIPTFRTGADKKGFDESKLTRWKYQPDATAEKIIKHLDNGRIIVPGKFIKCPEKKVYRHTKKTWQAAQLFSTDADQIKSVEFNKETGEDLNPNGVEAFTDGNTLFELCPLIQSEAYAIGHSLNSLSPQKKTPHIRCRIHFLTEEPITNETDYKWLMLGLAAEYPIISAKRQPAQPVYGNAGNRRIVKDGEVHQLPTPFETKIYGNVLSIRRITELIARGKQAELDAHARKEAEQRDQDTPLDSEYTGQSVSLADWLREKRIPERGGRDGRYIFVDCPWENEHTSGFGAKDTAVWEVEDSGKFAFRCLHAHCEHRGWEDYRAQVAPKENQTQRPAVEWGRTNNTRRRNWI